MPNQQPKKSKRRIFPPGHPAAIASQQTADERYYRSPSSSTVDHTMLSRRKPGKPRLPDPITVTAKDDKSTDKYYAAGGSPSAKRELRRLAGKPPASRKIVKIPAPVPAPAPALQPQPQPQVAPGAMITADQSKSVRPLRLTEATSQAVTAARDNAVQLLMLGQPRVIIEAEPDAAQALRTQLSLLQASGKLTRQQVAAVRIVGLTKTVADTAAQTMGEPTQYLSALPPADESDPLEGVDMEEFVKGDEPAEPEPAPAVETRSALPPDEDDTD